MKKLKNNLISQSPKTRLYNTPIPIIGLTGGIATGKSTVAEYLKSCGHNIIDADALVKSIYKLKSSNDFVKLHFPEAITNDEIQFQKLREIIFSNPSYLEKIEQFIYSQMPDYFLKALANFNNPPFIFYDVPLLFEKNLHLKVDFSVCVYAPRNIQIERLIKRDNVDQGLAEKILNKQMDIELKKNLSQFIINNLKTKQDLEKEILLFLNSIYE